MRGIPLTELARRNGYSEQTIKQVFQRPYPAIEKIIADFLDVKPWEIWPDRYTKGRNPKPRMGWRRWAKAQERGEA